MEAVKLDKALSDFRSAATVGKSGKNPMFKSEYSTLGDVLSALNNISDYGLAFKQYFSDDCLITTVSHIETGEKFDSAIPIRPEKNTPQSMISCVTYLRRASLMTMFGLNADDDDGNLASGGGALSSRSRPMPKTPVASPQVTGVTNTVLAEKLDACESAKDVNALYTTLYGASGIKCPDDQLSMFKSRKEELA